MRTLVFVGLLAAAGPLRAQAAADPLEAARITLRSDLRNVVTVQEAHFAEHGRYATTMEALAARFRPSRGVTIRIVEAEPNRYGAVATSDALGDGNCAVSIGWGATTRLATRREGRVYPEGAVACDGDARSEREVWMEEVARDLPNVLRRLAKAQERHYGKFGAYTDAVAQLDGWRTSAEVQLSIDVARTGDRSTGFRATATHVRAAGASCVIFVGFGPWRGRVMTARDSVRAEFELAPVCDDLKR